MAISKLESYIESILEYVNKKYEEYKRLLDRVNALWDEYRRAVMELKKKWDIDNALIYAKIEELKNELELTKHLIEELRIKRELDIIDEETFNAGLSSLNEILSRISTLYDELKSRYEEIENSIKEHWIRSIDTVGLSLEKVEALLKELEDAKSRGEIDEATYERLVKDLEIVKRVIQALEIIRSR